MNMALLFLGSSPDRGQSPVECGDFPSVRPSVHPSVPPLEGPRASQAGLRPSQSGLRASQAGLRASQPGLRASQPGLRGSEACLAGSEAWLDGSKACLAGSWALEGGNGRTDGRKISPFYRTSSPIGAAAQKATVKVSSKSLNLLNFRKFLKPKLENLAISATTQKIKNVFDFFRYH